MVVNIPVETLVSNGIEFDHENNEYVITKHIYMHIPSHAVITSNPLNDKIITFTFDNVSITIYEYATLMIFFNKILGVEYL